MIKYGQECCYKLFPKTVKVKAGIHKDFVGEVWNTSTNKVEIETRSGWYITEPITNVEVLEMKRRLVLKD